MPSKHMLRKGKRRQSVRAEYRAARTAEQERAAEQEIAGAIDPGGAELDAEPTPLLDAARDSTPDPSHLPDLDLDDSADLMPIPASLTVDTSAAGQRLDAYLARVIPSLSRVRVQLLISGGQVLVDGAPARASLKLRGGEAIAIEGGPHPEPLHATPEDIPLDILYEDQYIAVVNKAAGMMVHAGAGSTDDARNRGTLVNALLHHMQQLSSTGGELRPGIVHRLDKETSGAILVAKDDLTHRKLSEMFSTRRVRKTYIALVHGSLAQDALTVTLPIARDLVRRTRMTTRRHDGRSAVSHIHVLQRLNTPYGPFTLVEVRIETGRTHQIRVHMQSLGHPVVGDTLYGAPRWIRPSAISVASHKTKRTRSAKRPIDEQTLAGSLPQIGLGRNFLHAAHLEFAHPRSGKPLAIEAPLAEELQDFLESLTVTAERAD
ncbi:MAG TPA: RluA family pseudouridine synthase [Acidobacteriaceae bacterium]|nr:RluA family pseudouridine synthase [Acidobacteriaceae bacterium]